MKCTSSKPCNTLAALMTEAVINFVSPIKLPDLEGNFTGMVIRGKTYLVDNKPVIDSHILYFCPGCGTAFGAIVPNYAPPLQSAKPKSRLIRI